MQKEQIDHVSTNFYHSTFMKKKKEKENSSYVLKFSSYPVQQLVEIPN